MQCEGHTNSPGEGRPGAVVQGQHGEGGTGGVGTGGQQKLGRGQTQAGAGGSIRQPVPKIQPTGHPRPPTGRGNICVWEGKKGQRNLVFSLANIAHCSWGSSLLNADQKAEGHIRDRGGHWGAYHEQQRLPVKAGGGCPKLKLYDQGGEGKYNFVHQTKG